jgi:hypothetical protein
MIYVCTYYTHVYIIPGPRQDFSFVRSFHPETCWQRPKTSGLSGCFGVLAIGFWILGIRHWVLDTGYWVLGTKTCWCVRMLWAWAQPNILTLGPGMYHCIYTHHIIHTHHTFSKGWDYLVSDRGSNLCLWIISPLVGSLCVHHGNARGYQARNCGCNLCLGFAGSPHFAGA